jgi:hypothetical protein
MTGEAVKPIIIGNLNSYYFALSLSRVLASGLGGSK